MITYFINCFSLSCFFGWESRVNIINDSCVGAQELGSRVGAGAEDPMYRKPEPVKTPENGSRKTVSRAFLEGARASKYNL